MNLSQYDRSAQSRHLRIDRSCLSLSASARSQNLNKEKIALIRSYRISKVIENLDRYSSTSQGYDITTIEIVADDAKSAEAVLKFVLTCFGSAIHS